MKYLYRFLLLLCPILSFHSSIAQQDTALHNYYASLLQVNGVKLPGNSTLTAYADIKRIADYNFDAYRHYNTVAHVKLANGPMIELASITDRITAGKTVDSNIVARSRSIAAVTYAHDLAPIVDVRIGYKEPIKSKETTTYFVTPKENR